MKCRYPEVQSLCDAWAALRERVRNHALGAIDYARMRHQMESSNGDVAHPEPAGLFWAIDRLWEAERVIRRAVSRCDERDALAWGLVRLYGLETPQDVLRELQNHSSPHWSITKLRADLDRIIERVDREVWVRMDRAGMIRRMRTPIP